MIIVVTGAHGRLGKRLCPYLASRGHTVLSPNRSEVDWAVPVDVGRYLGECNPDVVFGLAAYTNVPKADEDKRSCKRNTFQTADTVAYWCSSTNTLYLHISSDYVVPILMGHGGGYYARCKLDAERTVLSHGGSVVRLSFVTPEQVAGWSFVNGYTLSHRWWVEDAARALVRLLSVEDLPQLVEIGPKEATTAYEMLLARYPEHPALSHVVRNPQEMQKIIGYAAPPDTRFSTIFEV